MVGMEMLEKLWLHKCSEYRIQKTLCSEREVRERRCYKGWLPGFWQNQQDDNITGNRNTVKELIQVRWGVQYPRQWVILNMLNLRHL